MKIRSNPETLSLQQKNDLVDLGTWHQLIKGVIRDGEIPRDPSRRVGGGGGAADVEGWSHQSLVQERRTAPVDTIGGYP